MPGQTAYMNNPELVAPCGIHCGTCYAYIREKRKCPGCRLLTDNVPQFRHRCKIANCQILAETGSGFCYDCKKIPCQRLKQLDKRYRIRYNTSLIQNLELIKDNGMDIFLEMEEMKRTCPTCGAIISVHHDGCATCKKQPE